MTGRILLLLALLAVACGGPTPYRQAGALWGEYGYSDVALGGEEYGVTVRATGATPDARVADMLVLRAAEVARDHGRTHFIVLHHDAGVRNDPGTRVLSVPVGGLLVPVLVQEVVRREKSGHLVIRLCASDQAGAVDAAATAREVRARLDSGS